MTTKRHKDKLAEEINYLRKELEDYLEDKKNPTESEVVKISQKLDELIVSYYQTND